MSNVNAYIAICLSNKQINRYKSKRIKEVSTNIDLILYELDMLIRFIHSHIFFFVALTCK